MKTAVTQRTAFLLVAFAAPFFVAPAAHAAQPQIVSTTYICNKDIVVDPKAIQGHPHLSDPPPELSGVDVSHAIRARDLILHGTKREREGELKAIEQHPENYPPAVYFFAARSFWRDGRREDAAFWFYAGQLRTRYDAARCGDAAAKEAVTLLSETYGTEITEGLSDEIEIARTAVQKAIEWDRQTPHNYDPKWINLHAVTVYLTASGSQIPETVSMSVDKTQWPAIAEQKRQQFQQEFDRAAAKIQHRNESPDDDDLD